MQALITTANRLEAFTSLIGKLAAWFLVAMMLVIVGDVVLRHWFVIGSTKLQELEWHFHGALFLLCLAWAYNKGSHVRIELVSEKLSPRTRAWTELLGCLMFLLPYCIAVIYYGLDYVGYSFAYHEASSSPTGLSHRWIIKAAIPIGFTLLALSAATRVCRCVVFLFGTPEQANQLTDQFGAHAPEKILPESTHG